MRINGVWVGWGMGDNSSVDFTVQQAKAFMRRKYASYCSDLADTNVFDQQMYDKVCMMQDRLVASGNLIVGQFTRGVLDLQTEYAMGFKKQVVTLPIIFTVEGHLSNMFIGPCADTATRLEQQGVCHHKPIGYDNGALPFNNKSGVDELVHQMSQTRIEGPPGMLWEFGAGTPWGIMGFSQGAMIVSDFMVKHVLPEDGSLHHRLNDFRRGMAMGNPRREKDQCCSWATHPPKAGTQGIMDVLFNASTTVVADRWTERAAHGDMFAENGTDQASVDKTAIARIVCENSWVGGPTSLFARVLALFGHLPAGAFAAIVASFEAIVFAASNPNPHYSTVSEPGDVEWMRAVKS